MKCLINTAKLLNTNPNLSNFRVTLDELMSFILLQSWIKYVVSFLLGKSPASVYYCMPTFRNSLSVPSSKAMVEPLPKKMEPIESSETSAYNNTLTPGTYPKENKLHSMTFAQRRNRLTTHFSERIPVVKRRMTVLLCPLRY